MTQQPQTYFQSCFRLKLIRWQPSSNLCQVPSKHVIYIYIYVKGSKALFTFIVLFQVVPCSMTASARCRLEFEPQALCGEHIITPPKMLDNKYVLDASVALGGATLLITYL